jgi:hypothetical protein
MTILARLTRARLDRSPAIVGGSPTSFPGGSSRPHPWGKLVLGLLPLALVLLLEADILRRRGVAGFVGTPDARFYVYQLHRMGELRGRWWELGSDALVGRPYPTAAAKHPGIYEGLDLLLPSAITSRFLDPVANYLALLTLALACNGWVAALLAYHLTHSYRWSALAVVLITWNLSTGVRMQVLGHLHLLQFGWVLLAAYAYSRFLDAPTPRRGLLLGLAAALVLQGSFYFGYFLVLGLGLLALGEAIAGRLGRHHVASAVVATLTFALLGAALTFPVWTIARRAALVDQYFHRTVAETWEYGSDLVQYILSPLIGKVRALFLRQRPSGFWESWHYPGLVILAAAGAVVVARLRGRALGGADPRLLERLVMLAAILVVLSLAGGPSVLLFCVAPSFRCYGRAGMLAVAVASVVAPAILAAWSDRWRSARLRAAFFGGALTLALVDGGAHVRDPLHEAGASLEADPPWVDWLASKPSDVGLAAFPAPRVPKVWGATVDRWNWNGLYYRLRHGHPTLNGAEFALLEADLERRGASIDQMNEQGLRFIASLGYDRLAFHRDYLRENPWIESLPWLTQTEILGEWSIHRVSLVEASDRTKRRKDSGKVGD